MKLALAMGLLVSCGGGHAVPDAATADGTPVDASSVADAGIPVVTGMLDPSFGSNGLVTMDLGGADAASGVVIEASGRIVVAAVTELANGSSFGSLVAFTGSGTIDATFGSNGIIEPSAAGPVLGTGSDDAFYVVDERILADGSPDPAWGNEGVATGAYPMPIGFVGNTIQSVAVDAEGRLYGIGESASSTMVVFRTDPAGVADTAFGSEGYAQPGAGEPFGGAIQSDGQIMVAGIDGVAARVYRVAADGAVTNYVATFGTENIRLCGIGVDAQDRSTVVGIRTNASVSSFSVFAARLTIGGTLDSTFGGGMIDVTTSSGPSGSGRCITTIVVEPDGSVIVPAGAAEASGPATVTAIAADAARETVYSVATGGSPVFFQAAVDPSGAIVAVGATDPGMPDSDIIVARFLPP